MIMMAVLALCWSLLLPMTAQGSFDGTSLGKAVATIVQNEPCVRLFHSKGAIGSRTPRRSVTVADLLHWDGNTVLEQTALRDIDSSVVIVISSTILNSSTVQYLNYLESVRGLVVCDEGPSMPTSVSPDAQTPQGSNTPSAALTIGSSHQWNPVGNGMLYQEYDFPILMGDPGSCSALIYSAKKNGQLGPHKFPRFKASLDFYFGPDDVNSTQCLGWRDVLGNPVPQCMPIGGQSVWGSLGGRTAMDSTTLFHDATPAANEAVASITALLAAMQSLSSTASLTVNDLPSNLAFALFQADEWGFAGSRRFLQDLTGRCESSISAADSRDGSGSCLNPLQPSLAFRDLDILNVAHVLAIDQIGLSSPLYAVYDSTTSNDVAPTALLGNLSAAAASLGLSCTPYDSTDGLPPTPLTSFVRQSTQPLSAAVLAGYKSAFTDTRYHSHYDTASRINTTAIVATSTLLARTTYTLLGGSAARLSNINASPELVSNLLDCLTANMNCELMSSYIRSELSNLESYLGRPVRAPPVPTPPTYYSGIIASYQSLPLLQHGSSLYSSWMGTFDPSKDKIFLIPKPLESFLRSYLAHTVSFTNPSRWQAGSCTSDANCKGTCDGGLSHFECLQGTCVCRTLAYYHTALDPGLLAQTTPDFFQVNDSSTPNWAEPNWQSIGMSFYSVASPALERVAFGVGLTVLIVSLGAALFLRRLLVKALLLR